MAVQEVTDYFKARSVCDDELATRDELEAAYCYVVALGGRDKAEDALLEELEARLGPRR